MPLVAVSKTKQVTKIREIYALDQRDFGKNNEASKYGCAPQGASTLAHKAASHMQLNPCGLMTFGLLSGNETWIHKCFSVLRQTLDALAIEQIQRVRMHKLSMGMSGDYTLAIEECGTVVRIGQAIFGPRTLPDSHYWPETKGAG